MITREKYYGIVNFQLKPHSVIWRLSVVSFIGLNIESKQFIANIQIRHHNSEFNFNPTFMTSSDALMDPTAFRVRFTYN